MNRHKSILLLLLAVASASCEKNAVQDITTVPSGAAIRFFHFGVNAPGVNFYADGTKMTALLSATGVELTTGVVYGGAGVGSTGYYSAIAPGQYTFTGKIAATTDKDLSISPVPFAITSGKYYSYYMSGFYNTGTKTVEGFVVEDPIPPMDYAQTYVRFVNAISNSTPQILYARHTVTGVETAIGGAIAYKGAGAFTALPPGSYDLNTRASGSSTNVISRTAVSFNAGRVYTISARGDFTIASTGTATNRAFLDNTANR